MAKADQGAEGGRVESGAKKHGANGAIKASLSKWLTSPLAKPVVFLLALLPLFAYLGMFFSGNLGANPIEAVVRASGDWALRMLLVALAVTPLSRWGRQPVLLRFRRMLGLFAFFYAVLHVLAYVGLDQFFHFSTIWADILKRQYITVGMVAFTILLLLALTSPRAVSRAMGGKAWRILHKWVYVAAPLAVLHHYMMLKAGWGTAGWHLGAVVVLLFLRLLWWQQWWGCIKLSK